MSNHATWLRRLIQRLNFNHFHFWKGGRVLWWAGFSSLRYRSEGHFLSVCSQARTTQPFLSILHPPPIYALLGRLRLRGISDQKKNCQIWLEQNWIIIHCVGGRRPMMSKIVFVFVIILRCCWFVLFSFSNKYMVEFSRSYKICDNVTFWHWHIMGLLLLFIKNE